jgi:hypothetical protein
MGTRSRIGVMHGDVCKSVYCHWDGYLEHNGRILQEYYDSARANHLVALGDISSLGPVLGQAHPFSKFEITDTDSEREAKLALMELAETEGWCTFYGRDRGEIGVEFKTDLSFADFLARAEGCGAEFYYIMRDGVWYVGDTYGTTAMSGQLVPLAEAMAPAKTWETVDL